MTNFLANIFKKGDHIPKSSNIELVKFRKTLLSSLNHSHKNRTLIGIYSNILGDGMCVTGIEDIYEYGDDHIVELKRYDVIGKKLHKNTVALSDIKAICVFDMPYQSPEHGNTSTTSRH